MKPKLSLEQYGDLFAYTEEEKTAIREYIGTGYKRINSFLVNDGGEYERKNGLRNDFARESEDSMSFYTKQLESLFETMPKVYSALLKSQAREGESSGPQRLHRGTSQKEVESLQRGAVIDKMLSSSAVENGSNWASFAYGNGANAAHMVIQLERNSRSTNLRS